MCASGEEDARQEHSEAWMVCEEVKSELFKEKEVEDAEKPTRIGGEHHMAGTDSGSTTNGKELLLSALSFRDLFQAPQMLMCSH